MMILLLCIVVVVFCSDRDKLKAISAYWEVPRFQSIGVIWHWYICRAGLFYTRS